MEAAATEPRKIEPRKIYISKYGSAGDLELRDAPTDSVGDGDVRIAVKYSGINFADIQMRLGFYPDAPPRPFVPGYEVSGHVDAVGKNVTRFKEGDPIIAGTYFGGYASHIVVPEAQAFPLPGGMDLAAGAALPVAFFTAQLALLEMARLRAGDRVLVECATGGVGTIAIQMARRTGAEVVGLTTSPSKLGYIRDLGAEAHTREAFYAKPELSGFDVIINASGGREISKQMQRLGICGRIVCLGMSSGVKDGRRNFLRMAKAALQTPRLSVIKMFNDNVGVFALNVLHVMRDDAWIERLSASFASFQDMDIRPHVHQAFPPEKVAAAHELLQTRGALGKLLIEW